MSSDAINLEYKMKKGEELRYRSITHSKQAIVENNVKQEIDSCLEMIMLQRCNKIDSDGTMQIDVTIESQSLVVDGKNEPVNEIGKKISMTMKKTGEIIKTNVDTPFTLPPFPSEDLKKKDKWQEHSTVRIPGRKEPITLNYRYTLWDFTEAHGYECAEIKVSCPENRVILQEGVAQVLSAKGTTYFSIKEGRLIKSDIESKTYITAPNDASVITRIKVCVDLLDEKKTNDEENESTSAMVSPQGHGAGFGEAETNKEVEKSAIELAKETLEKEGWSVTSVECDKCGFDLRCIKKAKEINVEVKGVKGSIISLIITERERCQAEGNPKFWIYVVIDALDEPQLKRYSGKEFLETFNLKPISYKAELKTM